jgi:hypothetical protein
MTGWSMWDLSEFFGGGVRALITDSDQDFFLPEKVAGDPLSAGQRSFLLKNDIDPQRIFQIRQVHGGSVLKIDQAVLKKTKGLPEVDAVVTGLCDVILSVRTADCLPVFFYEPECRCTALAHAGWRSTRQDIVGSVLKMMQNDFQADPAQVRVIFGPSLRSCCYQVGEEFCDWFPDHVVHRTGRWFFDLATFNLDRLTGLGVRRENVYDAEMCTCCDPRFFSFRRDGEKAGRHLSLLRIKE